MFGAACELAISVVADDLKLQLFLASTCAMVVCQ